MPEWDAKEIIRSLPVNSYFKNFPLSSAKRVRLEKVKSCKTNRVFFNWIKPTPSKIAPWKQTKVWTRYAVFSFCYPIFITFLSIIIHFLLSVLLISMENIKYFIYLQGGLCLKNTFNTFDLRKRQNKRYTKRKLA